MWKGLTSPGDRYPGRARQRWLTGPVWRRLKTRKDFKIVATFGLILRWLNCGNGSGGEGAKSRSKGTEVFSRQGRRGLEAGRQETGGSSQG